MTNRTTARTRLSLAPLMAITLMGCGGESAERVPAELGEESKAGGTAVICSNSGVESLNPFLSPDQGAVDLKPALFVTLVRYGDAGEFEPLLATNWDWQRERRGLVFRIRTDVTWHDGVPLTAEDVAWTVRIAADPEYGYLGLGDFESLSEAVARDSVTVELTFTAPLGAGLEPFVALPILPRHLLAELSPTEFQTAEYHRSPIGSGPLRFAERRADGSLVFERYAGYPEGLGRAYLDRLVRRTVPEPSTIVAELESGGVDLCVTSSAPADQIPSSSRLRVVPFEPTLTQVMPLNTRRPPLDDVRVRRAVSAALRRSDVVAVVSSVARPASGPLAAQSPWYQSDIAQPDADSALAAALLDEAGWTRANGTRRNSQGVELEFTLAAPQGSEGIVTVVQASLRRLGIGVDLRFMEWASYVDLIQDPDRRPAAMFLAFVPEKIFNPAAELYSQFHTEGFSNLSSYSVAEVDSLLERLGQATAVEELSRIYREIQRRSAEDVPILYVVNDPRVIIMSPRLQGVETDLNGPLASLTRWWIPQERRR